MKQSFQTSRVKPDPSVVSVMGNIVLTNWMASFIAFMLFFGMMFGSWCRHVSAHEQRINASRAELELRWGLQRILFRQPISRRYRRARNKLTGLRPCRFPGTELWMDKTELWENTRVFSGNSTLAGVSPVPGNRETISSRYGEKKGMLRELSFGWTTTSSGRIRVPDAQPCGKK